MTNEWMYGYTLFRQSPISPRLSVSVFRPGEAVESSAATMARWKTNPTEIDWDGLHLTTSYNILNPTWKLQSPGRLQHLRSNIWNASGIPGIFFSRTRRLTQLGLWWSPADLLGMVEIGMTQTQQTQTSQWNSQWKILKIGTSVYALNSIYVKM